MKNVVPWVIIFYLGLLLISGTSTSSSVNLEDTISLSQIQEGPDIYIRMNGLCADGSILLPTNITYRIPIEVSDRDNVTEVFADITEGHPTHSYRVYAHLYEGDTTNGTWMLTTSKFLSWEGGIFDINYTVWACDGLGNWNSEQGYRSTGMSPSILIQTLLIGSILFAAYAVNSRQKKLELSSTESITQQAR